jgi:hypothetical protein
MVDTAEAEGAARDTGNTGKPKARLPLLSMPPLQRPVQILQLLPQIPPQHPTHKHPWRRANFWTSRTSKCVNPTVADMEDAGNTADMADMESTVAMASTTGSTNRLLSLSPPLLTLALLLPPPLIPQLLLPLTLRVLLPMHQHPLLRVNLTSKSSKRAPGVVEVADAVVDAEGTENTEGTAGMATRNTTSTPKLLRIPLPLPPLLILLPPRHRMPLHLRPKHLWPLVRKVFSVPAS